VLGSPHAARAVEPHGESLRVIAAALLLVVVAWYTAPRPHSPSTVDDRLRPLFSGTRFTALIIGGLLFVTIGSAYHRRASFVIPTQANQHAIYSWTATQTPPDAVFLLDQFSTDGRYLSAVNPQKLRLVGRRAVVASLDYPFLDRDMRPWFARWQVALQGTTPDRVDHADLPTLLSIRRQFPFDYVIRRTPLPPDPKVTLQAVFDGSDSPGRILVYRITDG
jgi:hypothetical protein